jgi:hypothetical protein
MKAKMKISELAQNLFDKAQTGDKRKFKRAIRVFWQTVGVNVHWKLQSKHCKKAWQFNKP